MSEQIKNAAPWTLDKDTAKSLTQRFGSPLYVYDESTLRTQCSKLKSHFPKDNFKICYSVKANNSVALLKIIKEEGLGVEVMTPGEIYTASAASFEPSKMLFLSNNVSSDIFKYVIRYGSKVCLDSIDQIETYGKLTTNSDVFIRLNPQIGAGHHEKVITAGKVKFGVDLPVLEEAFETAKKNDLKITGLCIHIGSLFLNYDVFHTVVEKLLEIVEKHPQIEYVDFGGGFGIAYDRENEVDFPMEDYSKILNETLQDWLKKTKRKTVFGISPGRYVVAQCGVCLTTVMTDKTNMGIRFFGTDLGFNFFLRPTMYSSYHEIVNTSKTSDQKIKATIVGNICESGDILGEDRMLPSDTSQGDILMIRDTGAYGFSMSSNYNSMPKPAEVLIDKHGQAHLIRKHESYEDLLHRQII